MGQIQQTQPSLLHTQQEFFNNNKNFLKPTKPVDANGEEKHTIIKVIAGINPAIVEDNQVIAVINPVTTVVYQVIVEDNVEEEEEAAGIVE